MQIDLRTKIIPRNQRVWIVHAGRQKKFRQNFFELNKIFIDFPGFPYVESDLPSNEKEIYHAVFDVDLLKRSGKSKKDQSEGVYRPSRPSKRHQMMMGYVKRFYKDIKINDLIISPGRKQYDRLLIGTIKGDVTKSSKVLLHDYSTLPFPAREVIWHDSNVTKRELSTKLVIKMENPQAITTITDEDQLRTLFSELYGSFIWGDESKLDVSCRHGKNYLELIPLQELLQFLNAAYFSYVDNNYAELAGKDFNEIAHNYFDDAFIIHTSQKFSSPGYFRQVCKTALLVPFISICLNLAGAGNLTKAGIENLKITNSSSPLSREDEAKLKKMVKGLTESVLPTTITELNKKGKIAKTDTKMSTAAKLNE